MRRVKVVGVGVSDVFDWFAMALHGWPAHIGLPRINGIPRDARVLGVHHDYLRNQFRFTIEHPSFDPVADGTEPPILPGWQGEWLLVKLPQTDSPDQPVTVEASPCTS